ncbi:hypothetical protein NPIL_430531 [Nephila pilipes]|uniref:Uncharacterized protein n=1 Tax=Nephila pilipes TaxID=299642 RepID=A0A8X6TVG0_NEPPI|nr:hypothetical protein NPIL_430531 [Nephila pilipes]
MKSRDPGICTINDSLSPRPVVHHLLDQWFLATQYLLLIDINNTDGLRIEAVSICQKAVLGVILFLTCACRDVQGTTESPTNDHWICGQMPQYSIQLKG